MEIGNWKSVAGMTEIYNKARELGLESNIAEYEAFGFTVIEPEKTGAPKDFGKRLLDMTMAIADKEDRAAVGLNKHENRPAYGRQLFHLLAKDPIYREAMMNPVVQTMGKYMMGNSMRLLSMVAFVKEGPARSTHVHTDSVGVPSPLPALRQRLQHQLDPDRLHEGEGHAVLRAGQPPLLPSSDRPRPAEIHGRRRRRRPLRAADRQAGLARSSSTATCGTAPIRRRRTSCARMSSSASAATTTIRPESYDDLDEAIVQRGGPDFAQADRTHGLAGLRLGRAGLAEDGARAARLSVAIRLRGTPA